MLSTSSYRIHKYNDMYCLNDVVIQCKISINPKEYITSISDKTTYNYQSYVMKDKLIDILSNAKVTKAKELLKLLQDENTSTDILEIIDLNKKTNELINFVDYKQSIIQFNNKQLKYFIHNEQFYFKAKDVAEILEYVNTKTAIIDHVNITDRFNKEYFIPEFKGSETLPFQLIENNNIKGGETPPFQLIENKGSKKLPLQLTKTDFNLNKKVLDFLSKEHPQTIFINESGLYSLIFGSKKKEAIAFKQWVTSEVLPSIRRNGTYVSKKLLEYNKDELKNYYNKDCVYILHIKDNIYKYGKTSKIQDRFYKHSQNLDYINIEKIYVLNSINETNIMEIDIKELTKLNKINIYYNNGIEYFECHKLFTIEKVIEKIDDLYKKLKKNTNSTDLLLEKILGKLDNIDSRLTELENNKNQINNSGKCIDCNEETSKFATRCGKCDKKNKLKMAMEDGSKPTHVQLQKDLNELRFVSHVAKKYNVTPRIITRWIANYEKYNEMTKEPVKENNKTEKIKEDKYIKKSTHQETKEDIKQEPKEPVKEEIIPPTLENIKKDPKIENPEKYKHCPDCNTMIVLKSTRCLKCMNKNKIKETIINSGRPSLEQLKKDIVELKSMVKVGHKYNVSDNAIRKWIKNHEAFVDKV